MSQFFSDLAMFCKELAPVAGPLLHSIGTTANAVNRAQLRIKGELLEADHILLGDFESSPED